MNRENPPKWLLILAFIAIYIIWGTTYMAIAFGLKGIPPFLLMAFRGLIAGAILLAWRLARGERLPGAATIKAAAFSGILMIVGGTGLVAWAEQYVSTGTAAIIMATEPFFFVLLDKKQRSGYFSSKWVITGLLLGFTGIVLFFRFTDQHTQPAAGATMFWIGNGVLLLGAVLWVVGSLYARNHLDHRHSSSLTTGLQLLAAGLFCTLVSGLTGEWGRFSPREVPPAAWGGLLYLVVMGSLIAYLAFTWLITVRPPALVSTHTYVNPVVAVLVGWMLAGEQFSYLQAAALLVILTGVLLTNLPHYRPAEA